MSAIYLFQEALTLKQVIYAIPKNSHTSRMCVGELDLLSRRQLPVRLSVRSGERPARRLHAQSVRRFAERLTFRPIQVLFVVFSHES